MGWFLGLIAEVKAEKRLRDYFNRFTAESLAFKTGGGQISPDLPILSYGAQV